MTTQATQVLDAVRAAGWHRSGPISDADYRRLVSELGEPWCETAVELRPDVRSHLCKPEPIPFHTDHPRADLMAWRCEAQDAADGTQHLLDGLAALAACGRGVRDALASVHAEVRVRGDSPPERYSLVRQGTHGDRLFFAPWLAPLEQDDYSRSAYAALRGEIERRSLTHVEAVRLSEGEVLVIDNGPMLHGRAAIAPSSTRRLRRLWITLKSPQA